MVRKATLVIFLIALSSAVSVFGGGQPGEVSSSTGAAVNPKGVLPIVDEQITLNVFVSQDPLVVDYEDNYQSKLIEEKTNINVEWNLVPGQQVGDKLNLLLASGTDLPDVILSALSNEALLTYGGQGLFRPLNSYIDDYAVETIRMFDDFDATGVDVRNMYTAPDGNIYGLPRVSVCKWCETIWRSWVDTEWLNAVGMDIPKTVDDFTAMLKAFKNNDPNGNGKKDEIPLMGSKQGWGSQVEGYLMMPFIVYNANSSDRLIVDKKTGKVTAAYTQQGWREGVNYIRSLISDGLLDPVSLTQTRQEYQIMGEKEPAEVGAFLASNFVFLTLKNDKYKNYEAIPPLTSKNSSKGQTYRNENFALRDASFIITEDCENPAAAFRWGDFQLSAENALLSRYGKKGEDWIDATADQKGPFGDPAVFQEMGQWGSPTKNHLRSLWMYLSLDTLKGLAMADNSDSYYVMRTEKYDPVAVGNSPGRFFLLPAELDEYADLKTTLDSIVDENFARFITEDRPISEWDDFQEELKSAGVDRYLQMTEEAYKRQYLR